MPKLFPEPFLKNLVITIPGIGGTKDFYTLMTNCIRDLDTYGGCQCFPLYWYEKREAKQMSLFSADSPEYVRRDGISDFILERARRQYGKNVSKEDIFYYVYGFLHSPDYRAAFANDLKKGLPRLPLVDEAQDFWAFSRACRELRSCTSTTKKCRLVPACRLKEMNAACSGWIKCASRRKGARTQSSSITG
jgi:predicted helicase